MPRGEKALAQPDPPPAGLRRPPPPHRPRLHRPARPGPLGLPRDGWPGRPRRACAWKAAQPGFSRLLKRQPAFRCGNRHRLDRSRLRTLRSPSSWPTAGIDFDPIATRSTLIRCLAPAVSASPYARAMFLRCASSRTAGVTTARGTRPRGGPCHPFGRSAERNPAPAGHDLGMVLGMLFLGLRLWCGRLGCRGNRGTRLQAGAAPQVLVRTCGQRRRKRGEHLADDSFDFHRQISHQSRIPITTSDGLVLLLTSFRVCSRRWK